MAIITEVPDETCDWPFDLACCDWSDPEEPDPTPSLEVRQRAMNLAVMTLRMLTAYRVGGCPVTVRPCVQSCPCGREGFNPHINVQGAWVNSCGNGHGCHCGELPVLELPGPVGRVDEVIENGVTLVEGADYLVFDIGLVRVGGSWPTCQDMTAPLDQPNTLGVTYLNAFVPDHGAAVAAGVLACEYAKACQGKDCRLPRSVRALSRQGMTMEFPAEIFEGGLTGIREVDAWIKSWNPHALKASSVVYSPDLTRPAVRVQP